jgi:hypothetical protein
MPFNRHFVERVDEFLVMHFGLIGSSGVLLDRYACAILKIELDVQRKSILDYLGQTGSLGDPPPTWQPPQGTFQIELCNQVGLCGNPEFGEITLNNIVGKALSEMQQSSGRLEPDAVALLRSSMERHKHWIKDLLA